MVVSGLRICEGTVSPFRQVGLQRVDGIAPDAFQLGATVGAMRGDGSLSALRATGGLFHELPHIGGHRRMLRKTTSTVYKTYH